MRGHTSKKSEVPSSATVLVVSNSSVTASTATLKTELAKVTTKVIQPIEAVTAHFREGGQFLGLSGSSGPSKSTNPPGYFEDNDCGLALSISLTGATSVFSRSSLWLSTVTSFCDLGTIVVSGGTRGSAAGDVLVCNSMQLVDVYGGHQLFELDDSHCWRSHAIIFYQQN